MADTPVPRRLLVPFDFSEGSQRALAYAHSLVAALDGTLLVLHVGPPTTAFLSPFPDLAGFQMDAWVEARAQREEVALERLQAAVAEQLGDHVHPVLVYAEAEVPSAVSEVVAEHGVHLVVMGSAIGEAHGPLWRSMAEATLRGSGEFPVLVLR
jgi:nucleotide-binding universal stress UspA family protein